VVLRWRKNPPVVPIVVARKPAMFSEPTSLLASPVLTTLMINFILPRSSL
jgi:hypothetical protein